MPRLRILAAGSNAHGQLANETFDDSHVFRPCVFSTENISTPKHELPGDHVLSIVCGANHTLLLVELEHPSEQSHQPARQLWGCGDGLKGQLGPNHLRGVSQSCSPVFWRLDQTILGAAGMDDEKYTISAVAAAWESTFIVLRQKHVLLRNSRDLVIAMGNNDHGDLGVGLTPTELKYSQEPLRVALEEMLDAVYPEVLSGFRITDLVAGVHHVIATVQLFLQSGEEDVVVGWGASRHEQLGSFSSQSRLTLHKATRLTPITLYPQILPIFQRRPGHDASDPVIACALGSHHSVFLHYSGRTTGLGSMKKEQLPGLTDKPGTVKEVRCTWNGTYLMLQSGDDPTSNHSQWEILATGARDKGQLGRDFMASPTHGLGTVQFPFKTNTRRLVKVACGSEHVVVLLARIGELDSVRVEDGHEVWGWGWNEHGNLGLGHTIDAQLPLVIWPVSGAEQGGSHLHSIWAGCGTSWIVEKL